MTTTEVEATPLSRYQERVAKSRFEFDTLVKWHLEAHTQGGVELPHSPASSYCDMLVSTSEYNEEESKWESIIDADATIGRLSKVVKFARSRGHKVEKNYDSDFNVVVTINEEPRIAVTYYAKRDVVCEAKVIGKKVIPAQVIPERVVDEIEWECTKVSLLGTNGDSEDNGNSGT